MLSSRLTRPTPGAHVYPRPNLMNRRFLHRTAGLLAALVLASCFGDSTGPGLVHRVQLSLAPQLDPAAARLVSFDSVHIVLLRPADNSVALDTTVAFPQNVDTISLDLTIAVQGASEQFSLSLDLFDNATHSIVFHSGP